MDVIHSAYFPHFRAQMNAVPGMTTRMNFTPNTTTKEMRKIKNDPKFNYILLCNKICGKSHYKMKMDVEVLSEEEYAIWWASQKTAETFQMKYSSSDADTMENDEDKEVQSENSNDDSNEDSATSEVVINENN
jgi:cytochrome c oxidase subunit 2